MIASTRGLAVLAAIAVALAGWLAIDAARGGARVEDRALAPGFDAARVTQLAWGDVVIVRNARGWAWKDPPGRADRATVDAVLATLRGARWHRRAPRDQAGAARATLVVDGAQTFAIGAHLADAEQTWIARGDDAVLVDDWVAAALAPPPLALRDRRVFPDDEIPRLISRDAPVRLDPAFEHELRDAMARVEITAIGKPRYTLEHHATIAGAIGDVPCRGNDGLYVETAETSGCVPVTSWAVLQSWWRRLHGPAGPIADHRPLPSPPSRLVLADGATLDLAKRPKLGERDADPDRVAELVAALTAPAELVDQPPHGAPTATLTATLQGGATIVLDLYADHTLARHGEPVALRPTPAAYAALTRPSTALADTARWLEDPLTITALVVDQTRYTRGAVLGEWTATTATTAPAATPAVVDALAAAIAQLRAPPGPPPAHVAHTIVVEVTPPVGAPVQHRLELGPPTPQGCAARADGTPVALPLALCTAAAAAAPR